MRNVEVVQQMIDWIEDNMEEEPTLQKVSNVVGYSPWYCSCMFHDVTGMTMKSYVARRRLAKVTEEIRDTEERILDIAIRYGFSSQEALTRVFKEQYGCTPAAYRRENKPVPMIIHKHVLFPQYDEKRAHPIVTAHTAGWKMSGDKKVYFYGTGVPTDYTGEIPKGFEVREIPASDYLVFSYPIFDYMSENADVMGAVENLAFSFDPTALGYEWNDAECQIYQRHYPEKLGYQVVRPVIRKRG